ncbi:MAG: DEAD/DEAH box helicase [Saprospiraceae bacterium]|nr:DEAD/DEAH box helicase [Saprospiraceae bacterium]
MSFNKLGLIEPILKSLEEQGYTNPTPIQEKAIPEILKQRDILGVAQTGTGKTAAFAIPIIQLLHESGSANSKDIKTLILTPTRELAIQIGESFADYGKHLTITHTVIFGGVPSGRQILRLGRGVDILIATPGRLLDLMNQGHVKLHSLQQFVLDEADRMLDMGFIRDVRKIISKLPKKRQTLFFSATMPPEIHHLSKELLINPQKIEVTPVSSTVDIIKQSIYHVEKTEKNKLLVQILKDSVQGTALVFTRTKHGADKVSRILNREGLKSAAIHGNKSQIARQKALGDFKSGKLKVLVATDIAARGIDIDELSCVINFELPNIPETYVHRIGRTGRAGQSGVAISFCDTVEKTYLRDIQKLIKKQIPVMS